MAAFALTAEGGGGVTMADREERRFAEVSRDSVKLMAESTGVDLADDVAALLAEDVCYRLREAAQVRAAPIGRSPLQNRSRRLTWCFSPNRPALSL